MSTGHHVLFERWGWEAKGKNGTVRPAQKLRRMSGLIIEQMYNTQEHDDLHKALGHVAVPGYILGSSILSRYTNYPDDHLRSIDSLLEAINQAVERPHVKPLERELGLIMAKGIEAQLPFIQAVVC